MKQLKKFILAALGVCLFSACDIENKEDMIWDIAPVEFQIFITDNDGHDLLDSTFQNNLLKDITISYEGKTYPVMTEQEYYEEQYGNSQTRAYLPIFRGLILRQYWLPYHITYESFLLFFGESKRYSFPPFDCISLLNCFSMVIVPLSKLTQSHVSPMSSAFRIPVNRAAL